MVGFGKALFDIAVTHLRVECDIRVVLALEMLEIGERAGRLQLFVHDRRTRLRGEHFIEDRLEFIVLDHDEIGTVFSPYADHFASTTATGSPT